VDLRGRLSNPDIRGIVWHAAQVIAGFKIDPGSTASHSGAPKRWRLVDRLGEQIIRDLLRDSRAGTTQQRLAERYAISVSSVKRLLRRPDRTFRRKSRTIYSEGRRVMMRILVAGPTATLGCVNALAARR
jgi:hypothetical protein